MARSFPVSLKPTPATPKIAHLLHSPVQPAEQRTANLPSNLADKRNKHTFLEKNEFDLMIDKINKPWCDISE